MMNFKKYGILWTIFLAPFLCGSLVLAKDNLNIIELPTKILGKTLAKESVYLGGFSGLSFSHQKKNKLYFWTLTDRGPNAEPYQYKDSSVESRPFLLPDYQLRLVQLAYSISTKKVKITKTVLLTKPDGQKLSGLPNLKTDGDNIHKHEPPSNLVGDKLSLDPYGLDPEGIVTDEKGHFWLVDEYGPSIIEFNPKGKMLGKYVPKGTNYKAQHIYPVLPEIIKHRKKNRGFEAVSIVNNKLYAVLQSPLPTKPHNDVIRIVEFDLIKKQTSGMYVYLLDDVNKADKIGGMSHLSDNQFLIIERDGKKTENALKKIYAVNISKEKNLYNKTVNFNISNSLKLEKLPRKNLKTQYALSKTLWLDLKDHKLNSIADKYEGLAYLPKNQSLFLINDNDFGITGIFDSTTGVLENGTQLFQSFLFHLDLSK